MERGIVRVRCLAQEHNTTSSAKARTRITRSGDDERANHEATASPFYCGVDILPKQHFKRVLSLLLVVIFNFSFRQLNDAIISPMNILVDIPTTPHLLIALTHDVRHLFGRFGVDGKTVTWIHFVVIASCIFMGFSNASIYETWGYIWKKVTVAPFSRYLQKNSSKNKESESAKIR